MAHTNQLVGIIELDADPADLDAPLDENIGQTLRRLRHPPRERDGGWWHVDESEQPAVNWSDDASDAEHFVVLAADLRRLVLDLECELARLIDQLLLISNR